MGIWINALILLLVCLVPRATTLVFHFGDDATLAARFRGSPWSAAEVVDLLYVLVVVCIDLGILALMYASRPSVADAERQRLHRAKAATSAVLLTVVALSFFLPFENRYFLIAIPVVLFLENELSRGVEWLSRR